MRLLLLNPNTKPMLTDRMVAAASLDGQLSGLHFPDGCAQ
jgi:hypothetical protein